MRIAVAGKGGAGKTTLAGLLARALGRQGQSVVAIDADSNPNLAGILGITPEVATRMQPLSRDLLQEQMDASGKPYLTLAVAYQEVLAGYGVPGADNTTLLLMGRVQHGGAG
jgi:CO dehydrogenase maturation factor